MCEDESRMTAAAVQRQRLSAVDVLDRHQVLWEGLGVVEDDEHAGLGDVVRHAVVAQRHVARLLQRRRLHGVVALREVARQDLGHEHELVSVGVGRRVLVLDRQGRVYGEVNAPAVNGGWRDDKRLDR